MQEDLNNKHFIKNIEIKNFKCFEDFKAEGFGRVNLIGGKNNVGKTAFMEAVCINVSSIATSNLLFSLTMIERNRDRLNITENEVNIINLLREYKSFEIKGTHKVNYHFNDSSINKSLLLIIDEKEEEINFSAKIVFNKNEHIVFIDNSGFTNYELKEVYSAVQFQDKDNVINDYLKKFDENILQFKMINDKPYIKQKKDNDYYALNKFGDGLKQYISIISSLYATKNSFLFIDEIENGIHYTNLDKLWEIILTISKQQNVQVFATTHSKECIESYARVAKKLEDKEIKYIKMSQLKDGQIMAGVRDYDMLQYTMSDGHEVRGV
ncbi:AAA family ATPase [bacterium]|nr:AAA family ATPase [bacterium]MBU1959016.1 AAA family ATPase [bacterium]